ncbi:peptidylprolyl isomerase [Eggerthella sinensis]|uniref:peptidylprolyl isomerase n=1 Tax=Eggerthella sinensis TaxID=242230 RepID=UPI00248DB2F1|nr:peptidylprolyl isomerase [Eggerthella sinensis]
MGQILKPLYTPRYVPSGDEVAIIETDKGTMRVELFGKEAPLTVGNFVELAQKGFYDELNFYGRRDGDVVVGGCPITRPLRPQQVRMAVREQLRGIHPGMGDAGYVIADEWVGNPRNHHREGAVSLAHKKSADSGSCQFFFSLADHPEYDDQFTVFGQVIEGLEVMHRLRIGDLIERVRIEGAHELPADQAAADDETARKATEAVDELLSRKPVI